MTGESTAAIDEARARIERLAQIRVQSRKILERSVALVERADALCALRPESKIVKALKTDLKVGLTFAVVALRSDTPERRRNRRNARVAYDTVLRFAKRVPLSPADKAEIESRAAKLRAALKQLGESVDNGFGRIQRR